jgi:predicted MFS family arabinose efflux permease
VLAISFLSLGISFQIFEDRWSRYNYELEEVSSVFSNWSLEDLLGVLVFLGIGSFLMTAALGLMFYKRWARNLMQFGFVLVGLIWLVFLTYNLSDFHNAPIIISGITAAILGWVIGSLLFLNNTEWVLPHFQNYDENGSTVLDQDLTQERKP